jgi:sRNA-binding protein
MPNTKTRRNSKPVRDLAKAVKLVFPEVFNPDAPAPLAVGIGKEILREFPKAGKRNIRRFLFNWCRRYKYLAAVLVRGAMRRHLDGRPAGAVDAVARHRARMQCKKTFKQRLVVLPRPSNKKDA